MRGQTCGGFVYCSGDSCGPCGLATAGIATFGHVRLEHKSSHDAQRFHLLEWMCTIPCAVDGAAAKCAECSKCHMRYIFRQDSQWIGKRPVAMSTDYSAFAEM